MKVQRPYRPRSSPKSTDAIDRHVGHRMRAQRMMLGMSQSEVADRLALTFQQIQKYEKGVNRVGAGRLNQIGDILRVPVTYFYEGAPPSLSAELKPKAKAASSDDIAVSRIAAFLATKEGLLLMSSFLQIKNENIRRRLLALMAALSDSRAGKLGKGRNAIGPALD